MHWHAAALFLLEQTAFCPQGVGLHGSCLAVEILGAENRTKTCFSYHSDIDDTMTAGKRYCSCFFYIDDLKLSAVTLSSTQLFHGDSIIHAFTMYECTMHISIFKSIHHSTNNQPHTHTHTHLLVTL